MVWENLGIKNSGETEFSNMFLSLGSLMNQSELSEFLKLIKTALYDIIFMSTVGNRFQFLLQLFQSSMDFFIHITLQHRYYKKCNKITRALENIMKC